MKVKRDVDIKVLTEDVKRFAFQEGADKVGIAPAERLREVRLHPKGWKPYDVLPGVKSVIVFGIAGIHTPRMELRGHPYDDKIPGNIPLGLPEHTIDYCLIGSGWDQNPTLCDWLGYKVARYLIKRGFKAVPVPAGHPYDEKNLRSILSHKHAAVEAGLGEIGVNQLLVTPEFGANIYPCSVLTDAELKADRRFKEKLCEKTQEICDFACIKSCPAQALSKSGTIDKDKCVSFQLNVIQAIDPLLRCGACQIACPLGRI